MISKQAGADGGRSFRCLHDGARRLLTQLVAVCVEVTRWYGDGDSEACRQWSLQQPVVHETAGHHLRIGLGSMCVEHSGDRQTVALGQFQPIRLGVSKERLH